MALKQIFHEDQVSAWVSLVLWANLVLLISLLGSILNRLNLLRMRNSLWRPTTPELKPPSWDFAGGPVVRTCFYNSGHRFHPWSGNWNPSCHSAEPNNKQTNKTPPQFTTTWMFHMTQSDRPHKAWWPSRVQSWEFPGETGAHNPLLQFQCNRKTWNKARKRDDIWHKKMPMLLQMAYHQGAFPLHFCLKFEWNHMLQNMNCAYLCCWWQFLMICNSPFNDLNFLLWNCQKKSEM